MKKKSLYILIIILIAGIFVVYKLGIFTGNENKIETDMEVGVNIGDKAPDFTLETLYGQEISLSELQGKKVLLNFWASWCGPCRSEMPDLEKLHKVHENIEILAVNIKEEKGKVLNYVIASNYSFPIALDRSGKIANKYLVRGIPVSYFLNEKGKIIAKHTGALNYDKMKEFLNLK